MKYLQILVVSCGLCALACGESSPSSSLDGEIFPQDTGGETESGEEPLMDADTAAEAKPDAEKGDVHEDASSDGEIDDVEDGSAEEDASDPVLIEDSPVLIRKTETEGDLATGMGAQARVDGAWMVENEVARFYIQDVGVAAGLNLYGGNVIDGVLLDEGGNAGPDLFREAFPIIGFKVPTAEVIETGVGADGHPVLVVSGTDALSQVVDVLDALVAGPVGLEVVTEYGMLPGIPALRIHTKVKWPEEVSPTVLLFGELIAFGRSQLLFTEQNGFGPPADVAALTVLATQAPGASYALFQVGSTFSLLDIDSGGAAAIYNDVPVADDDGWIHLDRWIAVGDGSPASVLAVAHGIQESQVYSLGGQVKEILSEDWVAGIAVTAVRMTEEGPIAVNQALTDELGNFTMTLPLGEYSMVASAQDRERSEFVGIVAGQDEIVELEIGAPSTFTLNLEGPVRLTLEAKGAAPQDEFLGESNQGGYARRLYSHDGKGSFSVRPGGYTAYLSRGPEFSIVEMEINASPAEEVVFDTAPIREVETPGWLAGDFHQHTVGSLDSNMPVRTKLLENLAEGIDVATTTDHDNISDYGPYVEELNVGHLIHTLVGEEISYTSVGHFNAFPLGILEDNPFAMIGAQFWALKGPQKMAEDVVALFPDAIVQINHPRGGLSGYFSWLDLNPKTGEVQAEGKSLYKGFAAVEVNADLITPTLLLPEAEEELLAIEKDDIPAMVDWLNLVKSGYPITAMANSDSHNYGSGTGYPRSYLHVGEEDDVGALEHGDVVGAITGQQVVLSRGIIAWPEVGGVVHMGSLDPVSVDEAGTVLIELVVRAPSWVSVTEVYVLENGVPLPLSFDLEVEEVIPYEEGSYTWKSLGQESGVPLDSRVSFRITPEESSSYVFYVRGDGGGSPVFSGSSYALTNPLYVTVP